MPSSRSGLRSSSGSEGAVMQPHEAFLEKWHRIVAERDLEGLGGVLAEDVQMGAPPYFGKLSGHELVAHLLGIILHTIGGFRYHREWVKDNELALEFTGQVDGLDLQGIDLITLDREGRLVNLDVLIRPLNALEALRDRVAPQMAEYLARAADRR